MGPETTDAWLADIDRHSGSGHFMSGRAHGVDHCGDDHDDDDGDARTGCETVTFSTAPCDSCGSPLAGSRHAMTYVWQA